MFRIPTLAPIEVLAGLTSDDVGVKANSPLHRLIYKEMTMETDRDIDTQFDFYQKDQHHEGLMTDMVDQASLAITGVVGKVQNEVFGLIDDTYEKVMGNMAEFDAKYRGAVQHIVPDLYFLDSNEAMKVHDSIHDNLRRTELTTDEGSRFQGSTLGDIMHRISKTMPEGDYEAFASFVTHIGADVPAIYDAVIRRIESRTLPRYTQVGNFGIQYHHIEAIIGYHIALSLSMYHDDTTRMQEGEYNGYLGRVINNLLIRYKQASDAITKRLESGVDKVAFKMEGDTIHLYLYEPNIPTEDDAKALYFRDCANAVVETLPKRPFVSDTTTLFAVYDENITANNALLYAKEATLQIGRVLSKFLNSVHFEDWAAINTDTGVTKDLITDIQRRIVQYLSHRVAKSDNDIYGVIVGIICEVFYKDKQIQLLIGELRVLRETTDGSIHECLGIVIDNFIVDYIADMVGLKDGARYTDV